jgi:anti-sigma B factor antagonist
MSRAELGVTVEHRADTTVLSVRGELDATTTGELYESIALTLRRKPKVLVIDLSEVTFLASAGLTALVAATRLGAAETAVRVVVTGRACERPIHLTGLDEVLAIRSSITDALR